MKKRLLIVLLLFPLYEIQAQEGFAKNGVYLELFGNGGIYSLNYERFLSPDFSLRAGFGSFSGESFWGSEEISLTTFPLLGNYFYGKGRNKLELGAGFLVGTKKIESTWDETSSTTTIFDLTALIGYRNQKPGGGLIFRAGLTPFFALSGGEDAYPDEGLTISGGLSVGYAF